MIIEEVAVMLVLECRPRVYHRQTRVNVLFSHNEVSFTCILPGELPTGPMEKRKEVGYAVV